MKKHICLLACLWVWSMGFVSAKDVFLSTSFHEPANEGLRFIYSLDGLHWQEIEGTFLAPEVGTGKVMRDPSVQRAPDGTYHLVFTCSWKGDKGFGYASSKDLIHWTKQRHINIMEGTDAQNVWAPELFYDDVKKQFMIIWASCIPGKFPDYLEDAKNNHRLYYTTTRDFKTFAKPKLLLDPDFSSIDATMIKRAKDDYVLVLKDNSRKQRNIKVAFAKSPYGPWSKASESFTDSFCEGPSTLQVGQWWYIFFDSYRQKIYGAVRTRDFKTFQNQTGAVTFPVGHKHGTVFTAPEEVVSRLKQYNTDLVRYTGKAIARPERHDGGLTPVVGVHNIETMRGGNGKWLYNHQPMMAYWQGKFYMHYLSDPRSEHEMPGKTMLQTSRDGYTWSSPVELFPPYNVPDGYTKASVPDVVAKDLQAVMHQRVGWHVAKNGKLIATGNYGVVLIPTDDPNDGNGIGRVAREVRKDGTFGPIYFIYYNHGFSEKNTDYPYYKRSKDKAFVRACDEMLQDPMFRMQWAEEADRGEALLPLKSPYKAFSGYTLPDGRKVGLWKHALTSVSYDGGNTWREPVNRAAGFVNSNAKIWGQRLSDGMYATVYNPAEYRWPLAMSLSQDGLEYTTLNLLNGEVTPERHWGKYKSFGPQYTRGILEGNGETPDKDLWITYSNNKEDMWVGRICVPVKLRATAHESENFAKYTSLADMRSWNIYSPLWAPVELRRGALVLQDRDPYDYARVEKVIPETKELSVEFSLRMAQSDHGELQVEFCDNGGNVASKIVVDSLGQAKVKGGARFATLIKNYEAGRIYRIKAVLSQKMHNAVYYVDGKKACQRQFDTPVESISRVVFRTGAKFEKPDINTPADQLQDMPRADEEDYNAEYWLMNFSTASCDVDSAAGVLKYDDFRHYVRHFNEMEDENIETTIPNAKSEEWIGSNVPLFACSDKALEEMYYYRFWSLRKHIKLTPVGYGMTEFLVDRSYADRYNLIACAIGHHIMETRWLRDTTYLQQILHTWYRGNDGGAMRKMEKFSSWNPYAVWQAYKVLGNRSFTLDLLTDLDLEFDRWKSTHRLSSGLYWQGDVQDGMEESISGGRKKQYARPTINCYMQGNAAALAQMHAMKGETGKQRQYEAEAKELQELIETRLWSQKQSFFETLRGDTLALVREAIGYMPWYVGMPLSGKYDTAWLQTTDEKGFSAPFGLTTAERRHPLFRSHGSGTCEWDGAIWPFATSQTLTAMANYLNGFSEGTASTGASSGDKGVSGKAESKKVIDKSVFFRQMQLYTESQHYRGRPYIGEYLDEVTGYWLMGDRERSRYYNHSTFADLVITGIVGIRPEERGLTVNPLVPEGKLDYFALDQVNYHGHSLSVVYDKTGAVYHLGKGLMVLVDGEVVAQRSDLGELRIDEI